MLKNSRQTALVLAAVLTAGLLSGGILLAGKGKPPKDDPPPAPVGTIYYNQNGILATDAEGAGSVAVLPLGFAGDPSNWLYGNGHRWWLTIEEVEGSTRTYPGTNAPHRELYVFRPTGDGETVDMVRLTSLIDANENGGIVPLPAKNGFAGPVWSNGTDAFVSFRGYDFDLERYFLFRIPFGIDADGVPLVDETNLEHAVGLPSHSVGSYHWSPAGDEIVYTFNNELWLQSVGPATTPVLMPAGREPRWSPDGTRIAASDNSAAWGRLKIIDLDTGAVTTLLETEVKWYYDISWSPDSTALVFTQQKLKGRVSTPENWTFDVIWMPAAGGGTDQSHARPQRRMGRDRRLAG